MASATELEEIRKRHAHDQAFIDRNEHTGASRMWAAMHDDRGTLLALLSGAATPAPTAALTDAARDVLAERQRQVSAEGWSPEHDDHHSKGELAHAAACYAVGEKLFRPIVHHNGFPDLVTLWPWHLDWWKPVEPRRNLVKAGALIIAEIERLDRAASAKGASTRSPTIACMHINAVDPINRRIEPYCFACGSNMSIPNVDYKTFVLGASTTS